MVSWRSIHDFSRAHLRFHVRVSHQEFLSGFLWVSSGSLGFHAGYKQERPKQKKRNKQMQLRQEVEQQKQMTQEKNSRSRKAPKHKSRKSREEK